MEKIQIINPDALEFNETLGISEERANFLADTLGIIIEDATNPSTPVIDEAELLVRVCAPCTTPVEVAFACWKTAQVIQQKIF